VFWLIPGPAGVGPKGDGDMCAGVEGAAEPGAELRPDSLGEVDLCTHLDSRFCGNPPEAAVGQFARQNAPGNATPGC
jgi:hypothetical protein